MVRSALVACLFVGLALPASAAEFSQGTPKIKSIEAIAFGPDGLLLIGDGRGAQVVAVQTGDTKRVAWTEAPQGNFAEELAKRLGGEGKDIQILKLAVNPASQTVYLAVRKLPAKNDLLITLDGNGKVREFSLEDVKFASYPLPTSEKTPKITDLTYAKGKVLVAAQAGETFGSRIVAIDLEKKAEEASCTIATDTYHVAHNKWETNAPIRTVIPYELDGKTYLVGAFTCTPIVKYPLDDLKSGGRVKGQTIIELGSGNTPLDMFTYQKGGQTYILMNTVRFFHEKNPAGPSKYWTVKVDHDLLKEGDKINEKAIWRSKGKASVSLTDRAVIAEDFHGVIHMDQLDAERAVALREEKGGLRMVVLNLP